MGQLGSSSLYVPELARSSPGFAFCHLKAPGGSEPVYERQMSKRDTESSRASDHRPDNIRPESHVIRCRGVGHLRKIRSQTVLLQFRARVQADWHLWHQRSTHRDRPSNLGGKRTNTKGVYSPGTPTIPPSTICAVRDQGIGIAPYRGQRMGHNLD